MTKPELFIDEYIDWFRDVTGRVISLATMCRTIIRLGFTYKKVSLLTHLCLCTAHISDSFMVVYN